MFRIYKNKKSGENLHFFILQIEIYRINVTDPFLI